MNITHQITSMVRKNNKYGDPMWECQCKTGEKVWVNKHTDPAKDKFAYFVATEFAPVMLTMTEGQRIEWRQFPIQVEMTKDGDFWRLLAVAPRAAGQLPDVPYVPTLEFWKNKARLQCENVLSAGRATDYIRCWDTETTGFDAEAEIISFGCVNQDLDVVANYLMCPTNLSRIDLTRHVHGITPDQFERDVNFDDYYRSIFGHLADAIWLGYNIKFDIQMLDQECECYGVAPITPLAVIDVMEIVSWYLGKWDAANARWETCKLTEAAAELGVEVHGAAHDALNDAITTMMLVRKMAGV